MGEYFERKLIRGYRRSLLSACTNLCNFIRFRSGETRIGTEDKSIRKRGGGCVVMIESVIDVCEKEKRKKRRKKPFRLYATVED